MCSTPKSNLPHRWRLLQFLHSLHSPPQAELSSSQAQTPGMTHLPLSSRFRLSSSLRTASSGCAKSELWQADGGQLCKHKLGVFLSNSDEGLWRREKKEFLIFVPFFTAYLLAVDFTKWENTNIGIKLFYTPRGQSAIQRKYNFPKATSCQCEYIVLLLNLCW